MGAQIAAHFANAGVPVILFDLKTKEGHPSAIASKGLAALAKMKPQPLAAQELSQYIQVANYDDNAHLLANCELIIEAIAERLDWKQSLYHQIAPHIAPTTIFATNTSGLSLAKLASVLPAQLRQQFCGVHFFNPPRYMPLVELIAAPATDAAILDQLESFLVSRLGKGVVRAKDTPNFVANRIGVFSILAIMHYQQQFALPFEVVDELTGKRVGRAKSATYRTADVVGLDTLCQVIKTMQENCHDSFESAYSIPQWLTQLIANGQLGQKTKGGIYRKTAQGIEVISQDGTSYSLANHKASEEVVAILAAPDWATRLTKLRESLHPEAQFLWSTFRDLFHYCAVLVGQICDTPREIDLAIRRGFGWKEGPFEIWQQAGFSKITQWIQNDINANLTIGKAPLPHWVFECKDGVYVAGKHFSLRTHEFVSVAPLDVYKRQLFPERLLNETSLVKSEVIYENPGVKLWHSGDNIGILSFKSKMNAIGMDVLSGISEALDQAAQQCDAVVIWNEGDNFSVGANLEEFGFAIMMNGQEAVEQIISLGHEIIATKLRQSPIPVVAAVKGYTFGGGCEIMLHCSQVVAALESYIGLVEAGVGLIPAWGGSTEMARRAALVSDSWQDFTRRYQNLAMAKVATSAYEAKAMGFLRPQDLIVMNKHELLFIAKEQAKLLALNGYQPPLDQPIKVFGKQGLANIKGFIANLFAGNQISEHDQLIAHNLAEVMCGGAIEAGTQVPSNWLLNLEKQKFAELALSEKTADRIQYMLANGKPLRN
jgi:3-hydroxyacyl-CoA dehydrogenase